MWGVIGASKAEVGVGGAMEGRGRGIEEGRVGQRLPFQVGRGFQSHRQSQSNTKYITMSLIGREFTGWMLFNQKKVDNFSIQVSF